MYKEEVKIGEQGRETAYPGTVEAGFQKDYRLLIVDGIQKVNQPRNLKAILFVVQRIAENEALTSQAS